VDSKGRLTAASSVAIIAGVNSLNYTSTTSYAAGGTISGTSLTLSAASVTNPGLVSTGVQTFSGSKTFSGTIVSTSTNASSVAGKFVAGTNTAASASAVLEANSTTQGFLPPRMTLVQRDAIASPATGLIVMCSDCGVTNGAQGELQIYNGQAWRNIAGTEASGTTTGVTAPAIGSSYAGGIVAYILVSGDPGYEAGKIKGFIASGTDFSYQGRFNNGTTTSSITNSETAIGGGINNFPKLVAAYGTTLPSAVKAAATYSNTVNGVTYNDWYIPSKDELLKLYLNKTTIGNFVLDGTYYWTSNYCNGNSGAANYIRFNDGFVQCNGTEQSGRLRLIRNFTIDPETGITATNFNGNASSATNIAGGSAGGVVYQSAASTTSFVTPGTSGSILSSTGTTAPAWISTLPITSGGTGSSTQNFVDLTTAQTIAGSKTFTGTITAPVYSSSPVALTAGAIITWAPMSGLNASVTLNANSTLAFGTTPPAGSSGTLIVTQPASGSTYTLALPSAGTHKVLGSSYGITLSTTNNAKDIVSFYYDGTTYYWNVGIGYGTAQSLSANSLTGGVAGAIPYQTATNTTGFTTAGTVGQYLISQGTSAPIWTTPSFVDLTTTQSIGGNKTFTGTTTFNADGVINGLRIGRGAGNHNENTAFGVSALGTGTGSRNTAIGTSSLASYNGTGFNNNTSVGYNNLYALTNGTGNTSVGAESMTALITGSSNTSIGNQSLIITTGDNNTGVGKGSGSTLTTGSNNTLIGSTANVGTNNLTNATALGFGATVTSSNTVQLGNGSVTSVVTSGAITAPSIRLTTGASNGYILTSSADGTASWAASSSYISGGTTNAIPKYSSASAITPSAISDDGTTVSLASTRTLTGANAAVNAQTGTTYTLVQGDNGRVITMNNASAITLTIPSGLTAGFNCMIVQYGTGTVTIAGSGVTVVNRSNYTKTGGQYAIVTIVSPVANTFITGGDMQ
jgi:hypothetical protein